MNRNMLISALLAVLAGFSAAAYAAENSWFGRGTADEPYILLSVSDMDSLAERSARGESFQGLRFRLGADIDTLRCAINRFDGRLDGAGHSLTLDLQSEADTCGLFRVIGAEGSVERLVLKGRVCGTHYAAALAGDCRGRADSVVSEVTVSGQSNVAGIAAITSGTLSRCINQGALSADSYVAGISCKLLDKGSMMQCRNEADLRLPQASNVAGVLCFTGVRVPDSHLTGCINRGDISASELGAGIAVRCEAGMTLDSALNTGSVHVTGRYGGGIVAVATGDPVYKVTLTGCTNTGAVAGGENYLGGIAGFTSANVIIDSCLNTASISHTGTGAGAWIGGICGMTFGQLNFCANTGDISASLCYGVGGLAGGLQASARLNRSYNTGAVSAGPAAERGNRGMAGGLVGDAENTIITDCYNLGAVSGLSAVGGMAGMLHAGCALRRSYTAGAVNSPTPGADAQVGAAANIEDDAVAATQNLYYDADVCTRLSSFDREYAEGLPTARLCLSTPSELFDTARWCYPLLRIPAPQPQAVIASACIGYELAGDNADNVNGNLLLGYRPGLRWSANRCFELLTDSCMARPIHRGAGELTVAFEDTDLTRLFRLIVRSHTNSVADIDACAPVVSIRYYTLDGLSVSDPHNGQVLLRVVCRADGSVSVAKVGL